MTPLLENILNQGEALCAVGAHQFGSGFADLERAAELIRSKRRVILAAMGASLFACQCFEQELRELGFDAASVEAAELLYFAGNRLDQDAAMILVSRSGESIEVIKLLPRLKDRGVATIGIANVQNSTLSSVSDVAIRLGCPADQLVAIQSYVATVAVLRLIGAALAGKLSEARVELALTADVLIGNLPQYVMQSESWHSFLASEQPLYVLGRGQSMGIVAEGVLLMHETAKAPAVGMSIPQFRHGPVEVVDGRFRAVIFGTEEATAGLDAALFQDLESMGAAARWIGPAPAGVPVTELIPWAPTVPRRFFSVLEILPLQLAAYRLAEMRGVTPGDFRWAPLVTNTESGFTRRA